MRGRGVDEKVCVSCNRTAHLRERHDVSHDVVSNIGIAEMLAANAAE
jgi:hypothetical protein